MKKSTVRRPLTEKQRMAKQERDRERREEKKLERAGDAVLAGKPKKAAKILAEKRKPNAKQAVEVLTEAHTIESQLTALDHEIEGVKEHYKELKSRREMLVGRLRSEVRDMGQGRLPFQSGLSSETKKGTGAPKAAKGETTKAIGDTNGVKSDPIDAELSGKSELDALEGAGGTAKPKAGAA